MEPAATTSVAREPGGRYGDLTLLARQALTPRVSRMETELKLSELRAGRDLTAETGTISADAPPVAARAAQASSRVQPARERRGDPPPLQENPTYSLASFRGVATAPGQTAVVDQAQAEAVPATPAATALEPAQPPAPAATPPVPGAPLTAQKLIDPDGYGRSLRGVQNELQSLRADIAALAQSIGQPPPSPALVPTPAGMLQLHDPLSSTVQTKKYEVRQVEQGVTPQQIANDTEQQIASRRLTLKQEQLLRALQRAEQRLQNAPPSEVPPGLRDQVIGEIMRAKYNVAVFGGLGGAALTGRLASAVA